ncbi:MAG: peptide/nickel transport system ATP-binding protein ddpF, partial [Mycobacteriales bacterium]
LLIADEPTTALDVTIQKQILDLINDLRRDLGMAVILVTHDLGVIAGNADRVAVMYAGQVVEVAGVAGLFARSRHRYSEALFAALPGRAAGTGERLYSIPGMPPDLTAPPPACRFAARCTHRIDRCLTEVPALEPVPGSAGPRAHAYACFVPRDPAAHDPAGPAPSIRTGPAGLAPSDGRAAGDIAAGGPAASASSNHAGTASTASTAGAAGRGGLAGRGGRGVLDGASWIAPTTLIPDDGTALTQVTDLVKEFPVRTGAIRQSRVGAVSAVAGVTLRIDRGETVGLVGESGCGKTTLGRLIVGLDAPTSGEILFRGRRMDRLRGGQHREARRNVQLMFQDSYSALDPRMRVRAILREPLEIQRVGTSRDRDRRVDELLDAVGLPRGAAERYPHEFSGGQRQRIGLARALALQPGLIVADEPVSALDVSVQAQILNLMKDLQRERALTYLFISHDLAVVRYLSDRIAVMYLGKVVETGPSATLYAAPLHPYTKGLIDTVPVPDPAVEAVKAHSGVAGEVPSALHPPSGCRFRTRCPRAEDICAQVEPPLRPLTPGGDPAAAHEVACHFPLAPVGLAGPGRDERADPRLGPT